MALGGIFNVSETIPRPYWKDGSFILTILLLATYVLDLLLVLLASIHDIICEN